MELLALRTFLAVVDEGGILAASRKLNTVQSNVTTRIQRLEEELGNELFIRQGRRLILAPAGLVLQDYAQQLLALAQHTHNAVSEVGQHSGELRIGTMETFAAMRLPPALKTVRHQHPGLKLKVSTNPSQELIDQICNHQLDCAFVGGAVSHPQLVSETVLTEELVLISPRDQEPETLPLILFRQGCAYRARALQWQQETGQSSGELMELGTLDGIIGCVAVGLGCTLMPRWVLDGSRYADQLRISDIPAHIARIPTVMLRHKEMPPLKAFTTLRDAVLQQEGILETAIA